MQQRTQIRPFRTVCQEQLDKFCNTHPGPGCNSWIPDDLPGRECLLGSWTDGRLLGWVGLDLERHAIMGPFAAERNKSHELASRLLVAIERLAASYGMQRLFTRAPTLSTGFFLDRGFREVSEHPRTNRKPLLARSITRRTTRYGRLVRNIGRELGIPGDYGARHRLQLQPEAQHLCPIGRDIYDRPQRMTPQAGLAWKKLVKKAHREGVKLQAVSAFRSVDYQAGLVRRKLEKGQSMSQILSVSAAPGYSEHHSGNAIDVTTPGYDVLEEPFENSPAFEWLCENAPGHGFALSYPRNNRHGVAYEPWHWCWRKP